MPFAGHSFIINDLATTIALIIGRPPRVETFGWCQMKLMPALWELAWELAEMRYLFDLPHALDAGPSQAALQKFRVTPFDDVVRALPG